MNRRVLAVSLLLVAIFLTFRFCGNKPDQHVEDEKAAPIAHSASSDAFSQSFSTLLGSYYTLSDALAESDAAKAGAAATNLAASADSLDLSGIQGDTSGTIRETAQYFVSAINGSAKALAGAGDIEQKRKEFEVITDALWSLTRTVRYTGSKVYYQYCEKAFDNKGAYWLSDSAGITNPYGGGDLAQCGVVTDSLDYSKK
jgi:Cu(I)/Ag(I) efflux system membrane fusion protein